MVDERRCCAETWLDWNDSRDSRHAIADKLRLVARYAFTAKLAALSEEDGGVVTRTQLHGLDFSDDDISDGIARTLLTPVLRGVYLIARQTIEPIQLRHAATLYAAPAMVAGRAAAEHRGFLTLRPGVVTVHSRRRGVAKRLTTLAPMADGKPGLILVRPTEALDAEPVVGVPTATVPRMLLDIAAAESPGMLRRVWSQADYRGLLDLGEVDRALRESRRRGAPLVRDLLLEHPGRFGALGVFDSPSEVDFRQLVRDAGLPDPEINVPLRPEGKRYRADFYYRWLGLVIEVDDPSHGRGLARRSDAIRDADFIAAGLTVLRFDTDRLRREPDLCMAQLRAVIDRLTRARAT